MSKKKTTIIYTREYEEKKLVYRKIEIIRSQDRAEPEKDTRHFVVGVKP